MCSDPLEVPLSPVRMVHIRPVYSPKKRRAFFLNCGLRVFGTCMPMHGTMCVGGCVCCLAATVAKYLEANFFKPLRLFDRFRDAVVTSHPSSDAELCLDQCTASRCSPPEMKLQKSWLWKLNLLQILHHQQRIRRICSRSSFCRAVLLIIWMPVVVLVLCSLQDFCDWE